MQRPRGRPIRNDPRSRLTSSWFIISREIFPDANNFDARFIKANAFPRTKMVLNPGKNKVGKEPGPPLILLYYSCFSGRNSEVSLPCLRSSYLASCFDGLIPLTFSYLECYTPVRRLAISIRRPYKLSMCALLVIIKYARVYEIFSRDIAMQDHRG